MRASTWRRAQMGDPLDPAYRIGSLVSKSHFDKVRAYIEQAGAEKSDVCHGSGP